MGIFHLDYLLGTDTAIECVEKLLQVMYGDREDFDTPSMNFGLFMHKATCPGSGVLPAMTARHAVEYYDKLFKWWTRLRAVDVEAKLSELVHAATVGFDEDVPQNTTQSSGPWLMDRFDPFRAQTHEKFAKGSLVGNTYVSLALLVMASGARAPAELRDAFVKAAECEARNILDKGGDPACEAHVARRKLVFLINDHDFESGTRRVFLREPIGPADLQYTAELLNFPPPMPWFPNSENRYPIVICTVPPTESSPWMDTPTVRVFKLVMESGCPKHHPASNVIGRAVVVHGTRDDDLNGTVGLATDYDVEKGRYNVELRGPNNNPKVVSLRAACVREERYVPPPLVVADAAPTLQGVAIYAFGDAPPSKSSTKKEWRTKQTCANCGVTAKEKGKLLKCAKCRDATYCSRACQTAHWQVHKKRCKEWGKINDRVAKKMATDLSKLKNVPFEDWGKEKVW